MSYRLCDALSHTYCNPVPDKFLLLVYRSGRLGKSMVVMMRQFFIGVNNLRDQARASLPEDERELLFGAGCAMK